MHDHIQLIIARYREDIAWVDETGYDYVVYDKSGQSVTNAVPLPNIGREGHSYLTHIVRHYDDLARVCVFLQGDPFDHLDPSGRGTVDQLRSMVADIADKGVPFRGFAWFRLRCDPLGRPHDMCAPENKGRWAGWGRDIPVGEIFETLFAAPVPQEIVARGAAGCFAVSAERIRTRPRGFYERALALFEADPDDANNTGHAFERLWHFIFNGNTAWNRDRY
jgi:hypothetical protein